jgi:PAS domain S-box-containing protein
VQGAISGDDRFQVKYRIRRVDGVQRWVWEQGCVVRDSTGQVEAIEGFITDITEQEALAARVSQSEAQFRALVEQSLTGIYMIRDGCFGYVNARMAQIFGYSAGEMLALPSVLEIVHPDDWDLVRENLRVRLEGDVGDLRYEVRGRRKDGTDCDVEVHGRRVDLDGRPAVIGTLLDVTERKRAQRRYHRTHKMEALGLLATGVAHDFRNILSVIKTTTGLVRMSCQDEEILADLAEIEKAADHGALLSNQLTAFGTPNGPAVVGTSWTHMVDVMSPMLRRMLGRDISLSLAVQPSLPRVPLDSTQAEQVMLNLATNARDAMPEGGTLSIAAYLQVPSGGSPGLPPKAGSTVVLQVADNGVGIAPGARSRLFEPYFTTKGDSGTGLGLANVWRIVRDAGGEIDVESRPGGGTTFRIVLPSRGADPD